ncbi:MAG: sialidase family protein [Candidatus Thermoplasmatota archaeon]
MRTAALLACLIALAGCFSGSDEGGDDEGTSGTPVGPRVRLDPPTDLAFALPQVLGTVGGGAEPSIAVGPDGTLYVTTPLALWRSDDAGATWQGIGTPGCYLGLPACPVPELEEAPAPDTLRGGGDADLWVAPDGTAHWLGLFDGDNAIPYQNSTDKGATWSPVVDLAGEDSGDREWITGRADGTIFAAWRNFPAEDDATIRLKRSWDGGKSWEGPFDIADDTRQGGVAVDPSSNALALAYDVNGPLFVAHSFDNGTTWESVQVSDGPRLGHVFPVAAFDTNGTLYLIDARDYGEPDVPSNPAVSNRPFEHPDLYLWVSHDKGLTFDGPTQVNAEGTTAWFPWIAAGGPGRIVITWYQNDDGLPRGIGGDVYAMAGVSLDADFPEPRFARTRMSPDPVHTGPECREITGPCTRSLLDFFEVAIDPQGRAVSAWATDTYPVPRVSVEAGVMSDGPNLWEGGQFHT